MENNGNIFYNKDTGLCESPEGCAGYFKQED